MKEIWKRDKKTREYAEIMYARGDPEKETERIWRQRFKILFILATVLVIVLLFCFLQEPETGPLRDGRYLMRPETDSRIPLQVSGETDGETWEKKMTLKVKERAYTKKEEEELDQATLRFLQEDMKGKNPSLDQVSDALSFAGSVPGTEVKLQWDYDMEYIREDGKLIAKNIIEPVDTEVRVQAAAGSWKNTYYYTLHLLPRHYSPKELAVKEVRQALKETMAEQISKKEVQLPDTVGTTKVAYHAEEGEKSYLPVYLCLLGLCLLPFIWDRQQKRKLAEREEQLLLDHPGVVNKIMLLLSAGLTVRLAVERLASEYESERKSGGKLQYAYEEICVMNQEMRDGISEGKAMERFGRRCRLLPYLRFASVISQNIKKGTDGIIGILEKESLEALEQRKQRALQLGEKAGTKLLLPMILMLGIVIAIIMVPAFMTM